MLVALALSSLGLQASLRKCMYRGTFHEAGPSFSVSSPSPGRTKLTATPPPDVANLMGVGVTEGTEQRRRYALSSRWTRSFV